jgi:photosynthetic reaction center H subunit
MPTGAITGYIDIAQLTLYAFWIFFAGLIFYLRREDKREGYPLESDRSSRVRVQGFPPIPRAKMFILPHGGTQTAPRTGEPSVLVRARPVGPWPGAPLHPVGDPMLDGVGPAAYPLRADMPDMTLEGGLARIMPLRLASDFFVEPRDPDPRGMTVIGADRQVAGTVRDLWVDRSEVVVRYLEVELTASTGVRRALLPITSARIDAKRRQIRVAAILASQFAGVPGLQNPDQITLREEDRIAAYYASGHLYAEPSRLGPVL